jgi:hypothetical protein
MPLSPSPLRAMDDLSFENTPRCIRVVFTFLIANNLKLLRLLYSNNTIAREGSKTLLRGCEDGKRAGKSFACVVATDVSCESREGASRHHVTDKSPLGIRSEPDYQLAFRLSCSLS